MLCYAGKEIFDKRGTRKLTVPNKLELLQIESMHQEATTDNIKEIDKKMLLNDVAVKVEHSQNVDPIPINDINKILSDIDPNQVINTILKVGLYILKDLKKNLEIKFGQNCPSLNGYICDKLNKLNEELVLQQHSSSLSFDGREPRRDTLDKLLKLSEAFEIQQNFPMFKVDHIKSIIKNVLKLERRTAEKYLKCIKDYVKFTTDKTLLFNSDYDLLYFKDAVLVKIQESQNK